MTIKFEGEPFFWKGPSPFVFIAVPQEASENIKRMSKELSYGWGCIPVKAKINNTDWSTSLMPKDGKYLVPIKVFVQKAESSEVGKKEIVVLEIG